MIECPYFKDHRPQLSQIVLQRALEAAPSKALEVVTDTQILTHSLSHLACRLTAVDK